MVRKDLQCKLKRTKSLAEQCFFEFPTLLSILALEKVTQLMM